MFSNNNVNHQKETNEIRDEWETLGLELLHQKYKYDFTPSEKQLIRNMLKLSPPPLQYRRKVSFFSKVY